MQNSPDSVPADPILNDQQITGAAEPTLDAQTGAEVPAGSSSSSIGALTTASSSSSRPSSQSHRPPQQYTGLARVQILRKLKREVVRFRTFQNWQSTAIQPNVLAKAGFFFFNDGDKVQCAYCLGIVGQWDPGDDALTEHRRHFPRCPFILGLPVGNVPIDPLTGREPRWVQPTLGQVDRSLDTTGTRPEVRVDTGLNGKLRLSLLNCFGSFI